MARTHVIRDNDVLKAIVDQVGQHGRSRFLEETAREKLKRIELETAIRKGAGMLKNEDSPTGVTPFRYRRGCGPPGAEILTADDRPAR
jgi:hypothetical protein